MRFFIVCIALACLVSGCQPAAKEPVVPAVAPQMITVYSCSDEAVNASKQPLGGKYLQVSYSASKYVDSQTDAQITWRFSGKFNRLDEDVVLDSLRLWIVNDTNTWTTYEGWEKTYEVHELLNTSDPYESGDWLVTLPADKFIDIGGPMISITPRYCRVADATAQEVIAP